MITAERYDKAHCEYLRHQGKERFDKVRSTWIDCLLWAMPYRAKWLLSQSEGQRNNYHIVDPTHILALRSYVAGFLEGNTSATRPWFRIGSSDQEANKSPENHEWLDLFARRTLTCLSNSNFYHSAGQFYYDYGTVNTGAHFIDEIDGALYFHNLIPGAYTVINDAFGEAKTLILERTFMVKSLVDYYGRKKPNGSWDWSNFSSRVRKMYEDGDYTQTVEVVTIVKENPHFDPNEPIAGDNRQWVSLTYEIGGFGGQYYAQSNPEFGAGGVDVSNKDEARQYLRIAFSKRKPFIVGKSQANGNFEYGEDGPTLNALGLIKSLNKKAISKDQALEIMLRPPVQGPANLRKSYISTAPNSYVPLDATSLAQKGLRPIFEINPAIGSVIQDVEDLRLQVERLFYADYLLYLSRNPKTRTATETDAIVAEQQLIIGPNLQSLNWTYNVPVVDFVMDFVLDTDPYLPPPPPGLAGKFLRTEFISVFAQAQKAADLPQIDRYTRMVMEVGQLDPKIFDKVNVDKLADLYEDRLFLPAGLNRDQAEVDSMRQQAQAMARRQQMLQETLPAVAGAAKDVGIKVE